jgi:cholesterol transport system auxiliary component
MTNDIWAAPTRRGILVGGAAMTLAGCGGGGLIGPPSPAPQIYVLHPEFGPVADAAAVGWQLVVATPVAAASLDTERIALERAPNIMDYYASSQWPDRLPVLIQSLLVEALEKSGKIRAVGRETEGIRADYVLESEIRDFEAFYAVADTPPNIRVTITAKLLAALSHELVATTQASQQARAAANDMANITAAFTRAAGSALGDIVGWVLRAPSPRTG